MAARSLALGVAAAALGIQHRTVQVAESLPGRQERSGFAATHRDEGTAAGAPIPGTAESVTLSRPAMS
jgi:hypothetical protein